MSNSLPNSFSYNQLQFDFEPYLKEQDEEWLLLLSQQGFTRADVASFSGHGKHSVVCRHWLKGMCMKGDFCDFLHQLDYQRMPVCRQGAKGLFCADSKRGLCPFKHEQPIVANFDEGESDEKKRNEVEGQHRTDADKHMYGTNRVDSDQFAKRANLNTSISSQFRQAECIQYFFGFCALGPSCPKKHTPRDLQELPGALPIWYIEQVVANSEVFPFKLDHLTQKKLALVLDKVQSFSKGFNKATASVARDASHGASASHFRKRMGERNAGDSRGESDKIKTNPAEQEFYNLENSLDQQAHVPATGIPNLTDAEGMPAVKEDTFQCFVIKCNQMTNIYHSVKLGIWATGKANTHKLCEAFNTHDHVILLFSANESGGFQGYGRMMSLPLPSLHPGIWGVMTAKLGHNFRVKWIKQCRVEFEELASITNPLNSNLPLKKSRDGTEIPSNLAVYICNHLNQAPSEDLLAGTQLEGSGRIDHATYFQYLSKAGKLNQ